MPEKPPFHKFLQSFTPFYINNEFDEQVLEAINDEVIKYKDLLHSLSTAEGIEEFIKTHKNSLQIILSLVDLSLERFKRIITTIRIKKGDVVSTEWGVVRIRKEILKNADYKRYILDLFLNGSRSEIGANIPSYYLNNIKLDADSIMKLSSDFYLQRILKKVGDGKYNNDVGDKVENAIANELEKIKVKYGITFAREKFVPWIKRNMDFCIPNEQDPYVIIESSFQVTTGSGQTTKRNDEVKTAAVITDHNIQNDKQIAFVNLCDGAGWIARQSDLKKIYACSNYVINLNTLNLLEEIILEHVPPKYITR